MYVSSIISVSTLQACLPCHPASRITNPTVRDCSFKENQTGFEPVSPPSKDPSGRLSKLSRGVKPLPSHQGKQLALAVHLTRASHLDGPDGLAAPKFLGATSSKHTKGLAGTQATAEYVGWVLEQIQYQLGSHQSPFSTMTAVSASVSGLVSSSVVPAAYVSVPSSPANTVLSVPIQSNDNSEHCL
ncbi:hypothetical protein DSO57_1006441 [Entomophthora muscae]|uniref:Uncharacterized protein n=1 Tax=Entomophthora muscae TaxID=34485 RepID=A0ACC2UT82_9FUNG|nr:hypothetical protein DSO57_1006441 [Entomophthora muscae]